MNQKKKIKYKNTNITFSTNDNNKYYKNNIELLDDYQNSIHEDVFNNFIKNEIFNNIGHFNNIILLIGSGASVVGNKDKRFGHTVEMLGDTIKKELDGPTYFTIDELISMCKYDIDSDKNFNLEDFLSRMQSFSQFVSNKDKNKFENSYEKIIKIIKDKTFYDYDEKYFKHAKLIKQLTNLHTTPNRLSIVTTNYDTIIEESAYSLNYTVFDGFTFSHKPTFEAEMFDWYLSKPILDVKTQKESYKKSVINLLKIHGSLTWERNNNEIVRKNKSNVEKPIMIFPSSNKYMQSYEKPYFELFTKFQELLRKSNTVLITTGFSFADNHISQMVIQAIKNNPSLSVLITYYNITPEQPNQNWIEMTKLMENDYNIAFLQATMNNDLTKFFTRGEFDD